MFVWVSPRWRSFFSHFISVYKWNKSACRMSQFISHKLTYSTSSITSKRGEASLHRYVFFLCPMRPFALGFERHEAGSFFALFTTLCRYTLDSVNNGNMKMNSPAIDILLTLTMFHVRWYRSSIYHRTIPLKNIEIQSLLLEFTLALHALIRSTPHTVPLGPAIIES